METQGAMPEVSHRPACLPPTYCRPVQIFVVLGPLPPSHPPASDEERAVPGMPGRWWSPEEARAATQVGAGCLSFVGGTGWGGLRHGLMTQWVHDCDDFPPPLHHHSYTHTHRLLHTHTTRTHQHPAPAGEGAAEKGGLCAGGDPRGARQGRRGAGHLGDAAPAGRQARS